MPGKFKNILYNLCSSNRFIPSIAFIPLISLLIACEKDIDIVLSEGEEDIVVYGFIEQDLPPMVVLTKSLPVFSTTDI